MSLRDEEADVLVVLGVIERRHAAVLEVVVEGVAVIDVARRHGVSRQAVHRYEAMQVLQASSAGPVTRRPVPRTSICVA